MKNELILVIFGVRDPQETSHQKIINVSMSPVKCSQQITFTRLHACVKAEGGHFEHNLS